MSARTGTKLRNVLAVDLGGTKCSAAIVDPKGRILSRQTEPVDIRSSLAPVQQIVRLAKELAAPKKIKDAFAGVGIAVPGLVRRKGTVWAPNLPGWERMPLAQKLRHAFSIPVMVESDRNAAVLGECWRGAGRGKSDVIVVMVGTGIGAGILSGGRIVRGAHELSGCAGWLTVTREESQQSEVVGELESLAAGSAIAQAAQERIRRAESSSLRNFNPSQITAQQVAEAARAGDQLAIDVFARAGRFLGFGIANMVSLFDPEIVIIGGGMASAADLYWKSMNEAMLERVQPLAGKQVEVSVSKLGDRTNLLGCARLIWESLNEKALSPD